LPLATGHLITLSARAAGSEAGSLLAGTQTGRYTLCYGVAKKNLSCRRNGQSRL
jgi:hypothetical protein